MLNVVDGGAQSKRSFVDDDDDVMPLVVVQRCTSHHHAASSSHSCRLIESRFYVPLDTGHSGHVLPGQSLGLVK